MGISLPTGITSGAKGHSPLPWICGLSCLENHGKYIFPNGGFMISLLVIYHGTIHGTSPSTNLHPKAPHRTGRLGRGSIARGVAGGFGDPGGF